MKLEKARRLALARSHGICEGCGGRGSGLDPHHRDARGAGGVFGAAYEIANDVRNILALCRVCHDKTEHAGTWRECIGLGWRIVRGQDAHTTPALIHTVNGRDWWLLTDDGGYQWADLDPKTYRLAA